VQRAGLTFFETAVSYDSLHPREVEMPDETTPNEPEEPPSPPPPQVPPDKGEEVPLSREPDPDNTLDV
jgi:hypothetical protein